MKTAVSIIATAAVLAAGGGIVHSRSGGHTPHVPPPAGRAEPSVGADTFVPPPESAIPHNQFGDEVRQGERIFEHTGTYAQPFTGNALTCTNCHLDAGRLASSAPMWAAWVSFPAYRSKNGRVNTFQERLQGCFRFSMNGKAPPLGDPVLVALESYAYWLATGARVNEPLRGRGYPKLPSPGVPPSYAPGARVFARRCALCHGAEGQGQRAGGAQVFPPLWGPQSYNWGAGMAGIDKAAGFIKANMPLAMGGTLSDQDAWDVAMYINSHERPQDPRFTGSVATTRARYHRSPMSMYGMTVNGVLLGGSSVPSGGSTRTPRR